MNIILSADLVCPSEFALHEQPEVETPGYHFPGQTDHEWIFEYRWPSVIDPDKLPRIRKP